MIMFFVRFSEWFSFKMYKCSFSKISPLSINSQKLLDLKKTVHFSNNRSLFVTKRQNALQNSFINVKFLGIQTSCHFHTSKQRNLHPGIWIIIRPALKFAAVLTGRGVKKWWKELPADRKKYFLSRLKEKRKKIAIFLSLVLLLGCGYYISHIEETPITKRRRFMAFNPKQLDQINEHELKTILEEIGPKILPPNHPATLQVATIVKRIVDANRDIKEFHDKKFGIAVIDSPTENAFVLPIGQVFVFTGMINLCSNADQLGIILSHEIAHSILNHGAENVSYVHILDFISIAIIATIWAVIPSDYISVLTHWLYQQSIKILLELPYNRKIETEADEVGLQLAAKACFDVRESSAFWNKMAFLNKTLGPQPDVEFLSTHPNHETRAEHLNSLMDSALKIRSSCNCPKLSYRDPRLHTEAMSKALEISRKKYLEANTKPIIIIK